MTNCFQLILLYLQLYKLHLLNAFVYFDLMTAHVNITSLDGGEGLREMAYSIANGRDVHITITDGKGNDETYDVDLEGEVFDTNMNQILIDINPTDFISNTNDEGKYFKRRSEHRVMEAL